jgi:chemotaxis protein MotB
MTAAPALSGRVRVARDKRGVVISLAEAGFFEAGRAEIPAEDLGALDEIAEHLLAHDGRERLQLTIEGHTDDRPVRGGRYRSNLELSTARATFVAARLIAHDFVPARLAAAGYGEWRPADSNGTPEGRAKNRRVDILVQLDSTTESSERSDGRTR